MNLDRSPSSLSSEGEVGKGVRIKGKADGVATIAVRAPAADAGLKSARIALLGTGQLARQFYLACSARESFHQTRSWRRPPINKGRTILLTGSRSEQPRRVTL